MFNVWNKKSTGRGGSHLMKIGSAHCVESHINESFRSFLVVVVVARSRIHVGTFS